MAEERTKRKLSAVLSADVKGYSRLMGQDEAGTVNRLKEYRALMTDIIQHYRGRVVDYPGDNILAEFASVIDATECAVKIQQKLKIRNDEIPENRRMEFRIGLNLGDVIIEGERIYGDGVNIAARIEELADAGGICVTSNVYEQVKNKLSFIFEDTGVHPVKNITEPIHVYRLLTENYNAVIEASSEPDLPDKPSIAVMPFDNMSGDPEQEYFSDGMTEEIITALSKISEMFVIARNSSFVYKGKPVKVQQVGQELGVQYVLEGSVRKAGERVRITAQIIDASTGKHLWAERYDRELKDVFALQDEITQKIVIALQVELTRGEQARVWHRSSHNLEALGLASKALDIFERQTKEDNAKAQDLFKQATKLDPKYAFAWTYLAWTYLFDAIYEYSGSPDDSLYKALDIANKSLRMDDTQPDVHALWGTIYLGQGQHEKAIEAGERSIALGPNNACNTAILAQTMYFAGRGKEAIKLMEKAMRLSPYHPDWYLGLLAMSYIMMERYEEGLQIAEKQLEIVKKRGELGRGLIMSHLNLAEVNMLLGREKEARQHAKAVQRIDLSFSLEELGKAAFYKNPTYLESRLNVLRRTGLK